MSSSMPCTVPAPAPDVLRNRRALAHHSAAALDRLREEAADEVAAAFEDVSGKRIDRCNLPGFGRHGVSRALNGAETNPLYRLAGWLVLMRRLGVSRDRAQRWVDWLQAVVDLVWADDEEAADDFESVLEKEQDLDAEDDPHELRAAFGDVDALRRFIDVKRRQRAHDRTVLLVSQRRLMALEARA